MQHIPFKHSFIEAGFDIPNPVQSSAAGMDPEVLKQRSGRDLVFWGGGVLAEVRKQLLRRFEVLARGGGYVFNSIHNIQAGTPMPKKPSGGNLLEPKTPGGRKLSPAQM